MRYFGRAAAALLSTLALVAGAQAAPAAKAKAKAAAKAKAPAWGAADVCAIAARPEAPGYDNPEDPAAPAYPEDTATAAAAEARTDWEMGGWDPKWKARPEWGPCPVDHVRFDELWFTSDGRFARTVGGWQVGPRAGAWGYCLFEKRGKAWRPLGCPITAIS
jgi:hypothetical protein